MNAQQLPPKPELSIETESPGQSAAGEKGRDTAAKKDKKSSKKGYRPGRRALVWLCTAGVMLGCAGLYHGLTGSYEPSYGDLEVPTSDMYSSEIINTWQTEDDRIAVTARYEKLQPDAEVSGGWYKVYDTEGFCYEETESLPSFNYQTDIMYLTTFLEKSYDHSNASVDPETIVLEADDDFTLYVQPLSEYANGFDETEGMSSQQMYKKLQDIGVLPEYSIKVTDDSVDAQDGKVHYVLSDFGENTNYMNGSVNILFKKESEIVFAGIQEIWQDNEHISSVEQVYNAPAVIPGGYDEVEVIANF